MTAAAATTVKFTS